MEQDSIGTTRLIETPPSPALPEVRRTYQSALLDSTRWQHYSP